MKKPEELEIQFEYQYDPPTPESMAAYEEAFDIIVDMIIEDWLEENKTRANEMQKTRIVKVVSPQIVFFNWRRCPALWDRGGQIAHMHHP